MDGRRYKRRRTGSHAVWPLLDKVAAEGHKDLAANQRRGLKYKYDRVRYN